MISKLLNAKYRIEDTLEKFLAPFTLLAIRLYMGWIFFKSGKLKLDNYLNDNWDFTVYLFEEEHPVPFLSPDVAAVLGTGGELLFPILLVLGICGRCGAAGLLFMTAIIEFTYKSLPEHHMWALLLLVILTFGSGKISIEHFIRKRFDKNN